MPRMKAKTPGRSEAQVLAAVLDAVALLGIDLSRQNTGGFTNPRGQYVACGQPGNSDLIGMLKDGRMLMVEVKREGFDPGKLRGEKREHFERQLARLRATNAQGGVGFWTDDAVEFLEILRHVLAGARVEEPGYGRPVVFYPGGRAE
jgi:hypothetical protein